MSAQPTASRLPALEVILGLPLEPDGTAGRAAKSAQAFATRLRAVLSVPVEFVDESFTTVEAEEVLLAADLSRARRKQVVDRVAAALILRRWLDQRAQNDVGTDGEGADIRGERPPSR